jgi:hypothetical protein
MNELKTRVSMKWGVSAGVHECPRRRATRRRGRFVPTLICLFFISLPLTSPAYPEFRQSIVTRTGRAINCAYCHQNGDGPEGTGPGQIGSLTQADLTRLGQARAAVEPGNHVDSPILNSFGNHIINTIGKKHFLELRMAPEQLADLLPENSDLDQDGISDPQEYRDGTHPGLAVDGRPWLLFTHNLKECRTPIFRTLVATILGLYGLHHLLIAFARQTQLHPDEHKEH